VTDVSGVYRCITDSTLFVFESTIYNCDDDDDNDDDDYEGLLP